jgi:Tfp pilus assembly protein PilE
MTGMSNRGFTLIELIIFIIVGGIFLPLAMIAFTSAMKSASVPDYTIKARFYAEQKMEELTSKPYSDATLQVTETSYATITGSNGFQWKWRIKYIDTDFNELADTTTPTPNYKKITVFVQTPDNSVYDVSTIITKRPKS